MGDIEGGEGGREEAEGGESSLVRVFVVFVVFLLFFIDPPPLPHGISGKDKSIQSGKRRKARGDGKELIVLEFQIIEGCHLLKGIW